MKIKTFVSLVAATLLAVACSNDENIPHNGPVAASITAGVVGPDTRAVDNKWNADQIGVTVLEAAVSDMEKVYRNQCYATASMGTFSAHFFPVAADDSIFFQNASETVSFAAYAPYQPSQPGMLPGNDGTISYSIGINDYTPKRLPSIDFLWASTTGKAASPQVNFTFKHVMSRLVFVFFKGKGVDKLEELQYELSGLCSGGTFNTLTGYAEMDSTMDQALKYKIDVPFSTDMRSTLIAFPGQKGNLTLTVQMSGKSYQAKFPMTVEPGTTNSIPLKSGHSYTYNITLKKNELTVEQATIGAWVENTPQTVPAF